VASGGRLDAAAAVSALAGVTPAPPAPAAPAPTPAPPPGPAPAPPPPVAVPTPGTGGPVRSAVPAPVLRRVRVRGSLGGRSRRLRVTFSLSRPATVRFLVKRRGGRRAAGLWSVRARAGANTFSVRRRLPTQRTLGRGKYTLTVGLAATASSARFQVR
jgi:hypothetical protein